MKMVVGIDPSLTNTGIAFADTGTPDHPICESFATGKWRGPERLDFIQRYVMGLIHDHVDPRQVLVAYEDYAMNGKGRVFHLGELGGVLKLEIWRSGADLLIIPPSNLKMFVTGKGSADKEMVRQVMENQSGLQLTEDQADARGLYQMGRAYQQPLSWFEGVRNRKKKQALEGCLFIPGRPG